MTTDASASFSHVLGCNLIHLAANVEADGRTWMRPSKLSIVWCT